MLSSKMLVLHKVLEPTPRPLNYNLPKRCYEPLLRREIARAAFLPIQCGFRAIVLGSVLVYIFALHIVESVSNRWAVFALARSYDVVIR